MTEPAAPLDPWVAEVVAALGLPGDLASPELRDLVLDLARDVAHGVARPAAPLTTFLAGVAAGRAGGREADVRAAADGIRALIPGS